VFLRAILWLLPLAAFRVALAFAFPFAAFWPHLEHVVSAPRRCDKSGFVWNSFYHFLYSKIGWFLDWTSPYRQLGGMPFDSEMLVHKNNLKYIKYFN